MNNTNVAMEAIQLSAEQLGDSGSSGESDDEVILRTHTVTSMNSSIAPPPLLPTESRPVKVKEVVADELKEEGRKNGASGITLKPIEGPRVEPNMLKVMGIKNEPGKIERDGHVPTIYDIDIDQLEEKPWRKPDADITDWFNYGFTEDTWREYCNAQVRMRLHLLGKKTPNKAKIPIVPKADPSNTLTLKPPQRANITAPSQSQTYMKPIKTQPTNQTSMAPSQPTRRSNTSATAHGWTTTTNQLPPQAQMSQNPIAPPSMPPTSLPDIQGLLASTAGKSGADLNSLIPGLPGLISGMPELPPTIAKLFQKAKTEKGRSRRRERRSEDRSPERERRRRRRRRRSRSRDRDGSRERGRKYDGR